MIIDSHHHLWDPELADYPWMTDDLSSLRRRFDPSDLLPHLVTTGVQGTVVVQARRDTTETYELLSIADETPVMAGVLGWVDLTDPGLGGGTARRGYGLNLAFEALLPPGTPTPSVAPS